MTKQTIALVAERNTRPGKFELSPAGAVPEDYLSVPIVTGLLRKVTNWVGGLILGAFAMLVCGGHLYAQGQYSVSGTMNDGATLTGTMSISAAGLVTAANFTIGPPDSLALSAIIYDGIDTFPNGSIWLLQVGPAAGGTPYISIALPVSSLVGYSGGPICSLSMPCLSSGIGSGLVGGSGSSIVQSAIVTKLADWVWVGGSSTYLQPGVYGTLGTPAAGNIPGARDSAAFWTDGSGNFWLFGGEGVATTAGTYALLNDLWEFNPSTKLWTWMGGTQGFFQPGVYGTLGTPATGNFPGARASAITWTDKNGGTPSGVNL